MKQSKKPLWKKSMLQSLNYSGIVDWLYEVMDNGDMYGYEREETGESGYYQEYKDQFDDLSAGAYGLWEALQESIIRDNWDDMTVALLGHTQTVLGYDAVETDYFGILNCEQDWAVDEAAKRIERMTKRDLIYAFRQVMATLVLFFDVKAAHDCLVSIVEELDERGALLQKKNDEINRLYQDLTGANESDFDRIIENVPQRMWVE